MQKKIKNVTPTAFGHLMLEFEDGMKQMVHRGDHEAHQPKAGDLWPPREGSSPEPASLMDIIAPKPKEHIPKPNLKDALALHETGWVDGATLLNRIERILRRYVSLPDDDLYAVLPLWILGTYVYRVFPAYAYIWVNSPQPQSGKSMLLSVLANLSYDCKGVQTAATKAAIFRDISAGGGSLIVDEFEKATTRNEDLIAIFNSGYTVGQRVPRYNPNFRRMTGLMSTAPRRLLA